MARRTVHPSGYLKLGWKGLIPFIILTAAALISLQFLEKKNTLSSDFPENHSQLEELSRMKGHFSSNDEFVLLMLEPDEGNLAGALADLDRMSRELQNLPEVDRVLSPLDLIDLYDDGFSWDFIPLAEGEIQTEEDVRHFFAKLEDIGLYRKLFIGTDRNLILYVFSEDGVESGYFGSLILEWSERQDVKITLSGVPVLQSYYGKMIAGDIYRLPLYAFILILFIEFLLYRRLKISFLLGLASLIPTVWALALFPLFKLEMTLDNLMAPILVLGLASSYGIHLIRGRKVFQDLDLSGVLNRISGKITIAALTTLLGFSSLLLSPTSSIVYFGLITIFGIGFALVFSLYALPYLISWTPMPTDHGQIMMDRLHKPKGDGISLLFLAVFFGFLVYGVNQLYMDSRVLSLLPSGHEYHKSNAALVEGFGGVNELELILDSGEEYAAVSSEYFYNLSNLIDKIEELDGVKAAVSYIDFTGWMYSRILPLDGYENPKIPDEYFIGESLEILSDNSIEGFRLDSLISPSYRYVRVLIRYSSVRGRGSWEDSWKLFSEIEKATQESGLGTYWISGASIIQYLLIESHKNTIVRGLILFFPLLFIICFIYTRSIRWTLCILSSPILGALVYFGAMGILGIPLSIPPLISITCILGVSVDDNVFYTLSMMKKMEKGVSFEKALKESYHENGGAILDTSLVIVFVMISLFFSNNQAIRQSGLLIIISQSIVTVYTLWFLPSFYPHKQRMKQ
ncbi:MAG: MMPL family transporter [Spirochaetales bacterium]|nr:MMPL family transporter [Spirochaetales bacterium]